MVGRLIMDNLETSLVKEFKDREFAKHSLEWVGSYRLDGINAVESLGLPNLKNEDWRFTSLKDFANRNFTPYISKTKKYAKWIKANNKITLGSLKISLK